MYEHLRLDILICKLTSSLILALKNMPRVEIETDSLILTNNTKSLKELYEKICLCI